MSPDEVMQLLQGSPDEEMQQSAMIEALRGVQAQQGQEHSALEQALGRQRSQATGLRNLSLLTSLGANPILRGIQSASGDQGAQMESLAARTEQRLASSSLGRSPLELIRAQQAQERLRLAKAALIAAEKRAEEQREWSAGQRGLDRQSRERAAAIQAGDKVTQQKLEAETGLRKEFYALPPVKEFADTETNYRTLLEAVKDPSGMGATTTVFSIMKMLDPGVAVMQGDVDLIRQSGGKAAQWVNVYESVLNGNPLSDKVRRDILRQGTTLYKNRKSKVDQLASQYGVLAEDIGVNPNRVVLKPAGAPGPDISLDDPGSGSPVGSGTGNRTPEPPGTGGTRAAPASDSGPRIVSVKGMKPGDLVKSLQEGETVRVPMGGGKYQVVRKKNGKLVKVKE
jgi:hypothetical protein